MDDDQLAKNIAEKLGDTPGISYTEIATKAFERGKTALAIKVLKASYWLSYYILILFYFLHD